MTQKVIIGVGIGGYNFNAADNTITITGITTVTTKQVLLVVNNTRDKIIYNPTQAGLGGIVTSNVLTLEFNTNLQLNTDELSIHFALNPLTDPLPIAITGSLIGAATETTLSAVNTKLPSGLTVTANRLQVELPAGGTGLTNTELRATDVKVSLDGEVVPVTGNFFQTTQPISASTLPLPTGAATAANQQTNAITNTEIRATPLPISGTVNTGLTQPLTDTQIRATALPISAAVLPLPTGASTSALQGTGNTSLSSIEAKTPALGQALATASSPVVLTAAQLTTLTPLSSIAVSNFPATQAVTGTFFQATQPVSLASTTITGSVAITGALTDAQIRATALPISGTITVSNPTTNPETGLAKDGTDITTPTAMPTGGVGIRGWLSAIWTKLNGSLAVTGTFFQTTQPVSIAAMPTTQVTGTFFQTTQPISGTVTANTGLAQPLTDTQIRLTPLPISGTVSTGGLTDTQIRATPLPISGTVSTGGLTDSQIRATALPVSGTVIANIGTTNGIALDTSVNSLLKPASTLAAVTSITNAVTIKADTALNQTNALKVDGSAVTQPISVTSLPLATGASTSALQGTGNSSLSSIDTKLPTGLTVTANRLQVELPAGGSGLTNTEIRATALPVSVASLPLPSGASTEATLGALNTKIPSGLVVTTGRLQVELPAGGSGLTNTEIRATPLPISGTVAANATLSAETTKVIGTVNVAGTVPVSGSVTTGGLTDTQLRAAALTVTMSNTLALTDAQIRATALPVSGTFFQATQPVSIAAMPSTPVTGTFFQATQPVSLAANTPTLAAGVNTIGNLNELRAATLAVTVTAATGVAATLTLPAAGVGLYHYITSINISIYATAARTGAATPVVVTTTNLPGALAFTFETAQAIGTNTPVQGYNLVTPLKSAVVNTATTIVAPVATAGIWRITATYFTGV